MDIVWWFVAGVVVMFIGVVIGKMLDDKEKIRD